MRGYLSTMVVLLLASLLLLLYLAYQSAILAEAHSISTITPITYSAYFEDDVSSDLQSMLANASARRNSTNITVLIGDRLPRGGVVANLNSFGSYMESNFSNRTGVSLDMNLSPLQDGTYEILFSDGSFYSHDYGSSNQSVVFTSNGSSTGLKNITVNITVSGVVTNVTPWSWSPGGDTHIIIFLKDSVTTYNDSGQLSSTNLNSYVYAVAADSLNITFGNVTYANHSAAGSLQISERDVPASLRLELTKEHAEPLEYSFNCTMDYLQGRVRKAAPVLIGRS